MIVLDLFTVSSNTFFWHLKLVVWYVGRETKEKIQPLDPSARPETKTKQWKRGQGTDGFGEPVRVGQSMKIDVEKQEIWGWTCLDGDYCTRVALSKPMSLAIGYSESESESDSEPESTADDRGLDKLRHSRKDISGVDSKRRKIATPPVDILHRFSKTPLRVHGRRTATGRNDNKQEVTFVYVTVMPDAKFTSDISSILKYVQTKLQTDYGFRKDDLHLQNLSLNELTQGVNTLHVSLGYNMTLSRLELDSLIAETQSNSTLNSIVFPLDLHFQPDIHLLYNDDRSKVFVALCLAQDTASVLRPLVDHFNTYVRRSSDSAYDPSVLHMSLAVLSASTASLPLSLPCPPGVNSYSSVRAAGVELSRGRSVLTLLPRPPPRESETAEQGVAKEKQKRGRATRRGRGNTGQRVH